VEDVNLSFVVHQENTKEEPDVQLVQEDCELPPEFSHGSSGEDSDFQSPITLKRPATRASKK
jgi:hypothetical protein